MLLWHDGGMDDKMRRALFYQTLVEAMQGGETKVLPVFNEVASARMLPEREFVACIERLALDRRKVEDLLDRQYTAFAAMDPSVQVLTWEDDAWPKGTHDSVYCPRFLYLQGDAGLLCRPMVSVIGTRTPSVSGKRRCVETVRALGSRGLAIASGLALGIDGIAHKTALHDGYPTVAVLGTPIGMAYPPEHAALQAEVAAKGLLVSRYAPSVPMRKYYFLLRNRLMSSLSSASVIIEDRDGGGAVSQGEYALKQGRMVCFYQDVRDNASLLWPARLAGEGRTLVAKDPASLAKALAPSRTARPAPRPRRRRQFVPEGQLSLF